MLHVNTSHFFYFAFLPSLSSRGRCRTHVCSSGVDRPPKPMNNIDLVFAIHQSHLTVQPGSDSEQVSNVRMSESTCKRDVREVRGRRAVRAAGDWVG